MDPSQEAHSTTQRVLELLEQLGALANKGTSRFLLGLGALIILLAFATKLSVPWVHFVTTQPVEFVVMMLVGVVVVLSGAVVAFYADRSKLDVYRDQLMADKAPMGDPNLSGDQRRILRPENRVGGKVDHKGQAPSSSI